MFTVEEKARIRYHLGYPNTNPAATIQVGIARTADFSLLVDLTSEQITAQGEERVRGLLQKMDVIECKLFDASDRMSVSRTGDLHLRADEADALEREYGRWQRRLSDTLGTPIYPYSARGKGSTPGGARSVPVS